MSMTHELRRHPGCSARLASMCSADKDAGTVSNVPGATSIIVSNLACARQKVSGSDSGSSTPGCSRELMSYPPGSKQAILDFSVSHSLSHSRRRQRRNTKRMTRRRCSRRQWERWEMPCRCCRPCLSHALSPATLLKTAHAAIVCLWILIHQALTPPQQQQQIHHSTSCLMGSLHRVPAALAQAALCPRAVLLSVEMKNLLTASRARL
mmetsp:Transcript_8807/g.19714  ORF Transcript_8807/g.19714 Transcript_8807/m.19714 type:complete len:208 (-) Transcript_8807:98-721(-)